MKYFTTTIPPTLAEKLKEKGMPIVLPKVIFYSYAEVFDWLMEKGLFVNIEPIWDFANERITEDFESVVIRRGSIHTPTPTAEGSTWHEAATKAIEKAIELIKED